MDYKRKIMALLVGIIAILGISGCGKETDKMEHKLGDEQISQEEAKKIMDEETEYILLDVRTIGEFTESHIPGAICIPNETITDIEPNELPDKNQMILVYCRSGNRSKQAAGKLAHLGYNNVKEFGGINTWKYATE